MTLHNKTENVFLDVGGHRGETLAEVSKSLWLFDRIICFEPQAELAEDLHKKFASERVRIIPAALSDTDGETELFGSGDGASLFKNKRNVNSSQKQSITTINAAGFFRENISDNMRVIMKLNCEGGEGAILRNLAASGQINKIHNLMVDFDLRKVPGMKSEPRKILKLLHSKNFRNYFVSEEVMTGDSQSARVRNWLAHIPDLASFCTQPINIAQNRKNPPPLMRIHRFRRYHPAWSLPRLIQDTYTNLKK